MSRINDTKCSITGTELRRTAKAVQFRIDFIGKDALDVSKTEWFPFSQISTMSKDDEGNDVMMVSEWILKEKELL